jgi:predicted ferric reductase
MGGTSSGIPTWLALIYAVIGVVFAIVMRAAYPEWRRLFTVILVAKALILVSAILVIVTEGID